MVLLATLVAVLLYLDRVCLSTAAVPFGQDLKISSTQVDQVLGAFFWMYALGQLPAGWLGDRFGARWMLGSYIILWSLVTALMGFASTLTVAWILRMACGLFEAGAYPLAASIVRRWVPLRSRGKASALIAIGGRLGGAVAPVLTIQLMLLWTYGRGWVSAPDDAVAAITSWRPVMMLYGIVGIVIAIIFMWWFRDWPHLHPAVSEDELALIRDGDVAPPVASKASEFPPIMAMVSSFPMWMNCFVQFAANIGWGFLVTKMPQFLQQRYGPTIRNVMAVFWLLLYVFVNVTSILWLGAIAVHTVTGFNQDYAIVAIGVALATALTSVVAVVLSKVFARVYRASAPKPAEPA